VLSDDPGLWRAAPSSPDIFNDRPLILANGDPDWYQQLLVSAQPAIVFMDLHLQWLRVREKALNACLRRTNVVTVTETEYKAMPVTVKSGLILRSEQHALILKRGAQGVTLIVGNEERALPPPAPTQVNTDVGCGDHLLGLLAGHFIRSGPALAAAPLIDRLSQAYLASLAGLERLMESDSAYAFSWQSLQRIAAGDAWSAVDISGPMQAREDEHETN
jgi:sugar/nucleoside kinase (ribokinase family)